MTATSAPAPPAFTRDELERLIALTAEEANRPLAPDARAATLALWHKLLAHLARTPREAGR